MGDRISSINAKTEFYWSKDSILDINDILVNTLIEPVLAVGDTNSRSSIISYPRPIDTTNYFIFYKLDADSTELELNELNNVGYFQVSFPKYPNLTTLNLRDTIIGLSQQNIQIQYKVYNKGNELADSSQTIFSWSTDSLIDVTDFLLLNDTLPSISKTDSISSNINVQVPITSSGIYYVIYKLDDSNSLLELNEEDNTAFKIINVDISTGISNALDLHLKAYVYDRKLIIINDQTKHETLNVELINSLGQAIFSNELTLMNGKNSMQLPDHISPGIYFVILKSKNYIKTIPFSY